MTLPVLEHVAVPAAVGFVNVHVNAALSAPETCRATVTGAPVLSVPDSTSDTLNDVIVTCWATVMRLAFVVVENVAVLLTVA